MATRRRKKAGNGGGGITQLADGRWQARYTARDPEGKTLRKALYGRTWQEANAKLADALKARNDGTLIVTSGRQKTINYAADAWLKSMDALVAEGKRSPRTVTRYREVLGLYVRPTIGPKALVQLQPADVGRAMSAAGKLGRSARTVNYVRITCWALLSYAMTEGWVSRNVAMMTKPREKDRAELKPLPREDLGIVLADALDDPEGRLHVVSVALGTRQSETLGLDWSEHVDDLDGPKPQVHIRRTVQWDESRKLFFVRDINKTLKSRRDINIPAVAIEALRRQKRYQREARLAAGPEWNAEFGDLVFSDAQGRPLRRDGVSRRWSQRLKDLNISHVGFHAGTRHGAASLLHDQGVDLLTISRTLGHSQIHTTANLYTDLFDKSRRDAADAMDRALSGK